MKQALPTPPHVGVDVDLKYQTRTSRKVISVLTDIVTNQIEAYGFFKNETVANAYTKPYIDSTTHVKVKHAFPTGQTYSHLNVNINPWVIIVSYLDTNRMTATGFFSTQKEAYLHIKYVMIDLLNSPDHKLYVIQLKPYKKLVNKK